MICRRMPVRRDGASVAGQITSLLAYIDRSGRAADRGDLVDRGGRNFISTTREAQVAEMIATVSECLRARRPLEHLVLSWRPDEQPDRRQVREAVAILMRGLGLARHQALWAMHADTAGVHLHLVAARVDPETGQPATIRFMINALDRAVARIEYAQGWQPERNARFCVIEGITTATGEDDDERDGYDGLGTGTDGTNGQPGPAARNLGAGIAGSASRHEGNPDADALERRRSGSGRSGRGDRRASVAGRGARSGDGGRTRGDTEYAERALGERDRHARRSEEDRQAAVGTVPGSPVDDKAAEGISRTSPELANLRLGGWYAAVKLRAASWERRFGASLDAPDRETASEREATERRRQRARAVVLGLTGGDEGARMARKLLSVRLRAAHPGRWDDLPLARTLTDADTLSTSAADQEVRRGERSLERIAIEVAGPLIDAAVSWPDLHVALAREGIAYRRKGSGAVMLIGGVPVKASTYRKAALRALTERLGPYQSISDEAAGSTPIRAIEPAPGTDIRVFDVVRHDREMAALTHGEFARACAPLRPTSWRAQAILGERPRAAPGVREVADRLGLPRSRLVRPSRPKLPTLDPSSALGTCHAALRAERYGVLVRMSSRRSPAVPVATAAGDRTPGDPYDRLLRVPLGPMAIVAQAWPRIMDFVRSGASVDLRFTAPGQHHVVLRDLDAAGLARLRGDGHVPALVLGSGADRYEVVLRAPSRGQSDGPAVARQVGRTLARRYGCAVSDAGVQIVRTPEPDDGVAGSRAGIAARFVAWSDEICSRLADMIDRAIRRLRALRTLLAVPPPGLSRRHGHGKPLVPLRREDVAAYHAHRRDVLAGWEGRKPDNSRVDAMIARRLRATGHDEIAVTALIAACAGALEPYRRRDWSAYGRRAASLAFTPDVADGAEAEVKAKRVTAWMVLERRILERVAAVTALRAAVARPDEAVPRASTASPVPPETIVEPDIRGDVFQGDAQETAVPAIERISPALGPHAPIWPLPVEPIDERGDVPMLDAEPYPGSSVEAPSDQVVSMTKQPVIEPGDEVGSNGVGHTMGGWDADTGQWTDRRPFREIEAILYAHLKEHLAREHVGPFPEPPTGLGGKAIRTASRGRRPGGRGGAGPEI